MQRILGLLIVLGLTSVPPIAASKEPKANERGAAGRAQIQKALNKDEALLSWVDVTDGSGGVNEHWAVVLRANGPLITKTLSGQGKNGKFLEDDVSLPGRFRQAFERPMAAKADVDALAKALYRQRIAPVAKDLEGIKRLCVIAVSDMAGVPVEVLTDQFTVCYVPSRTFLASLKNRPAPAGSGILVVGDPKIQLKAAPALEEMVLRGPDLVRLSGTRIELNDLERVFGEKATILAGSDASKQKLEELRTTGALSKFRYLHFATHGKANNKRSFESVLYLAQDKLPKEPAPEQGKPPIDGQLSAREVLEDWKLDAELVTLAASESALGRSGGGDGYLGFTPAFLTAGARSVCVSLWPVDDAATVLLMDRFYRNLLGQREGLKQRMAKAEALAEAKTWLRHLTFDEAKKQAALLANSAPSEKGQKAIDLTLPKQLPNAKRDAAPFAHPKYWAAFILVGDPN